MKNLVLFGEDVFTAVVLQSLQDNNYNIPLVICPFYNNDKHIRLQQVTEKNEIEFAGVENVNSSTIKNRLTRLKPDLIVSVHLRKILKKEIFSIAKYGAINVHPSLLPKYRGLSPQHQAIIHGDKESAVTVHFIEESVDTGDIIIQEKILIRPDDYISDIQLKMLKVYENIVVESIKRISGGNFTPVKQSDAHSSYFGSLKREDRKIDFSKSKADAYNLVRAVSLPYKGAICDDLTIWQASKVDKMEEQKLIKRYSTPGLYKIEEDLILLVFKDGVLISDDFEKVIN